MPETPDLKQVDVVDDLGCDPTGSEPCAKTLQRALEDGIELVFPAGTYRMEDRLDISGFGAIGLRGEGDVRLVPPDNYNSFIIDVGEVQRFFLRGIDIDVSARATTAGVRVICRDAFVIDDVEYLGRGDHPDDRVVHAMILGLTTTSGRGLVRNYRALQGSAIGHYKNGDGRAGISIGPWNFGTIRVEDCHLEEFGNNGIYASRTSGNVEVIGGLFRNNNVAGIRISGNGSFVDGATVEVDLDSYTGPMTQLDSQFNTRGIAIEQGPADKPNGALVDGCTIRINSTRRSKGGINLFPTGRTVTVRNTTIEVNADGVPGVYRSPLESQGRFEPTTGPHWVFLENVRITGTAAGLAGVMLYDAPNSVIRDCTIEQSGPDRDGIFAANSVSTLVHGGSITTTRYPFVVEVNSRDATDACLFQFEANPQVQPSSRSSGPFQSGSTVVIDEGEYRIGGRGVLESDGCVAVEDFSPPMDGDNTLAITGVNDGGLEWLRFVTR